ncbi:MAG TPA: hypothetical protein VHM88_07585 [Candidatus Acidoferrales bacterium]|nr:hypothetical protein [Candidatus Acidoferrales bacterium]
MTSRGLRSALLASAIASFIAMTAGRVQPSHAQASSPPKNAQPAGADSSPEAMPPGGHHHGGDVTSPHGDSPTVTFKTVEWSIFNHRVAGGYVLIWGLTALIVGLQLPGRTWWRFVPPLTLLALTQFLFFRNDPDAWPIGPLGFWASLRDPEDLQHRIFVLLLLLMGIMELLRAADRLPRFLAKYGLACLAVIASVYLLFHMHGGSEMAGMMHDPAAAADPAMQHMMASMATVFHEHLWFSILGLAFAAGRLLGDTGRVNQRWATVFWSVCAILLGAYMIGYTE